MRCWSHRYNTSVAEEDGTTTGRTWTEDGKRRQAGTLVGLHRLYTQGCLKSSGNYLREPGCYFSRVMLYR